jgi:hypothetical protein
MGKERDVQMSDGIKYEYKVQFMDDRCGLWRDCTILCHPLSDARAYRRRFKDIHKDVPVRIVRRPSEWEVCE